MSLTTHKKSEIVGSEIEIVFRIATCLVKIILVSKLK